MASTNPDLTPNRQLPSPKPSDSPDVPGDIKALADKLDTDLHALFTPNNYVWAWEGPLTFGASGAGVTHGQGKDAVTALGMVVAGSFPLVLTGGDHDATNINLKAWKLDGTVFTGSVSRVQIIATFPR